MPAPASQLTVAGWDGVALSVRVRLGCSVTAGTPADSRPPDAPQSGVPAVLIHGFGASGQTNWGVTGWLTGLYRAGITTATVDLRGHGQSAKPHDPSAYSLPILLTDLQHVLAALVPMLGPVPLIDLIGYSMGGGLVAEMVAAASDRSAFPGRALWAEGLPGFRRAVIGGYDGRPLFDGLDGYELGVFRSVLAGRPASADKPAPNGLGRRIAAIAMADPANDLSALDAMVQGMLTVPHRMLGTAVDVPTLVVAGDRDGITYDTVRWSAELPHGRHLMLANRDHISAVTSAVFRAAAIDFLTG